MKQSKIQLVKADSVQNQLMQRELVKTLSAKEDNKLFCGIVRKLVTTHKTIVMIPK